MHRHSCSQQLQQLRQTGLIARLTIGLAASMIVLLSGCGAPASSGEVLVNDMKVPAGTLVFVPDVDAGVDGPSVLGNVREGVFETIEGVPLTPGKNSVMLTIPEKWLTSGGKDTSPMEETSAVTTLTQSFEIPKDGAIDLKFEHQVE